MQRFYKELELTITHSNTDSIILKVPQLNWFVMEKIGFLKSDFFININLVKYLQYHLNSTTQLCFIPHYF